MYMNILFYNFMTFDFVHRFWSSCASSYATWWSRQLNLTLAISSPMSNSPATETLEKTEVSFVKKKNVYSMWSIFPK